MKRILLSLFAAPFVLSCSNPLNEDDGVSDAVAGIYTRHSEGGYSIADDTLIITVVPKQRHLYTISRHVAYTRTAGSVRHQKQEKQERSLAVWQSTSRQLQEQKHGRRYFLSEDGRELLINAVPYRKQQ